MEFEQVAYLRTTCSAVYGRLIPSPRPMPLMTIYVAHWTVGVPRVMRIRRPVPTAATIDPRTMKGTYSREISASV